jgi:Na+-transporting NADH:ubiquinone oxidoreductase subunit C
MQRSGALYTVLFALSVCVVCGAMVSIPAVYLKDMQERNQVLDKQRKVLDVAGLVETGEKISNERITELFNENIEARYVEMDTGEYIDEETVGIAPEQYNQRKAAASDELGEVVDPNSARVKRKPKYAIVYLKRDEAGDLDRIVLPVEGYGLWGTLYGYVALESDGNTIAGLTFFEHKETPGLGGEVDNPNWKDLWHGRKVYGPQGEVQVRVRKGPAGTPEEAPYEVDGISGATITSNGVTNLLRYWLGPNGFKAYIENLQQGKLA